MKMHKGSASSTSTTSRTSTTSARAQIRSSTTTLPTRTSTEPSTTTSQPIEIIQSPLNSTNPSLLLNMVDTKELASNKPIEISPEYKLFCYPNCTGIYVGIAFGSLLGVALVILGFIVASRSYTRRGQSKSNTSNTHKISHWTTNLSNGIGHSTPTIMISRSVATLLPPQTTPRRSPLFSNSVPPDRVSDHIYMYTIPGQIQNPTQTPDPSRIYLELISDEPAYALPQPPGEGEHTYYNVALKGSSLIGVDNVEYEIVDNREQPAFSVSSNSQEKDVCAS